MVDLTVKLSGLTLRNPIVIGGSPLAGTAQHIIDCIDAGAGAVVTKTTNPVRYLQRYPRPLYALVDYKVNAQDPYYVPEYYTWMHREHNSIYPPETFAKIIACVSAYARERRVPIIGNFTARGVEEWVRIAGLYADAGADALELNFCCPFPPEGLAESEEDTRIGIYYTMNPEKAVDVVKAVKASVGIPVFAKISPDGAGFLKVARHLEQAGADGITMFANNKLLRIDVEKGMPFVYGPAAGTNPGMMADSLRWVAEVAMATRLAIMGGRGASTWRDAVEFLMAGARAVQYVQAIMLRGLGHIQTLVRGIEDFMDRHRYESISQITGMALRHVYSNADLVDKVKPLFAECDLHKCIGCRRCLQVCWYDAIKFHKKAVFVKENCAGCSMCSQVCPARAVTMRERDNDLDHFRALASAHRELAPLDTADV